MYLKRLTVTGFKSFAAKTVLDLEPGISAIVGPNGSGKSNLADAVRWALGEQSKNRLRLADREEVIFGGTEKRAKASYAEVVLLFDNESGAFPIDLTEVEISRRLYRSGEAEYRLGGRIVRLGDIQLLLAEAGFGAGSYAVIGQGTIDSFLISSPSERKLLFDEAAGIRASEVKREASLRKLTATAANLTRLTDISTELAPRLASLQRSMSAVNERQVLESKRTALRQRYLDATAFALVERELAAVRTLDELQLELDRLNHEIKALESEQQTRLTEAAKREAGTARIAAKLAELETEEVAVTGRLSEIKGNLDQLTQLSASAEVVKKRGRDLQLRLVAAQRRAQDIHDELVTNHAAGERAAKELARAATDVAKAQAELVALRQETADGTQQQYVSHALAVLQSLARKLQVGTVEPDELRLLVHKAGRLLSHATRTGEAELLRKLRSAQGHLESAMAKRETAIEHQTNLTIGLRSLEIDQGHQVELIDRLTASLAEATTEAASLHDSQLVVAELNREATKLRTRLERITAELTGLRHESRQGQDISAAEIAEAAARAERLRGQRAIALERQAQQSVDISAGTADQRTMAEQAKAWKLTPNPEAAHNASDTDLEQRLLRLDAELAARAQIEQDTTSEYTEVQARQLELVDQIRDLEQAQANLQQIVGELDVVIRQRFKESFAELSRHFSEYFVRLFEGGNAALELEEGDDGEYGITIKASPKGKRLTNLTALSGGERALAGVALLAAILRVNPSPFVVLDEIDAALDEANSGRLAAILAELKEHSQLIVITHNRQTMAAARVLYGVTMNAHHASHLLSLKLEEATGLAAR